MENPPFEDVFPIQDGDFPLLCLFKIRQEIKSYSDLNLNFDLLLLLVGIALP